MKNGLDKIVLQIKNLSIEYEKEDKKFPAIDRISISLKNGEILGIAGESGSGKTTLCKTIVGLLVGSISGEIIFEGRNLLKSSQSEWKNIRCNRISYCYSSSKEVLNPSYTIMQHMVEAILESKRMNKEMASEYAAKLLVDCSLKERKHDLFPRQLSGGEIQRALIALALVNNPDILMFDEPTTGLDSETKVEIITLLKKILSEKTAIIVSHDLSFLRELSDTIAILYSGRILEKASCEQFFTSPRHPYSRKLYDSYESINTGRQMIEIRGDMYSSRLDRKRCIFFDRCTQRIEICKKKVPELKEYSNGFIACHRGGVVKLLQLINISKSYPVKKVLFKKEWERIVRDINLYIESGEIVALVGASGAGKTTIGQIITNIIDYDRGEVVYDINIGKNDIQYIFQDPRDSFSSRFTVLEAVREPLDIRKEISLEQRNKKCKDMLSTVGLAAEYFAGKYCYQLSDGELQRIAFARAFVASPKLLIADESISRLDSSEMIRILRLLLNLQNRYGIGVLFITHKLQLARKISRRIYILHQGEIIEKGFTENVLLNLSQNYIKN